MSALFLTCVTLPQAASANSLGVVGGGCQANIRNVKTPAPGSAAYTDLGSCSSVGVDAGDGILFAASFDVSRSIPNSYYDSVHLLARTSALLYRLTY